MFGGRGKRSGFRHIPCREPCGGGFFAVEFREDHGFEAGHVGGAVEDAEAFSLFGGGDFLEFAEGDIVAVFEDGGAAGAFEFGGGAFCLVEDFGEEDFEFCGGVAAEEDAEEFGAVEFCGGGVVFGEILVVLSGHGFGHECHHGFAAGFLEGCEFFGCDVCVDHVVWRVVDLFELEGEFEHAAHGLLEEAERVGAGFGFVGGVVGFF